jgi:hypothetical protein
VYTFTSGDGTRFAFDYEDEGFELVVEEEDDDDMMVEVQNLI